MAKSKIFDFLNDLTNKGDFLEGSDMSNVGGNFKISSQQAHQKLLSYEIEILEGHLKREHQCFGEMVYTFFQQGKKVSKTNKELKPIFKVIDELNVKLNQKINEKNLGFSFLDKLTTKTNKVEVKNKVIKNKVKKGKVNKSKLGKTIKTNKKLVKKTAKK